MATSRPFAYNTGSQISGTQQFGSIAVGTPTSGVTGNPRWWNGPDEDLGYVIAQSVPSNTQTSPDGSNASVGFFRSSLLTENSFISIAQTVSGQVFASGNAAHTWLTGNSYWSSWVMTSTGVTFSQAFTSGQAPSASVETAWTTFRGQLTGTYTTMVLSNNLGTSLTVTDANVQSIANALRTGTTGTNFSVVIGSRTWSVIQGCVAGTADANSIYLTSAGVCNCGTAGSYTVRPMIKNANWGGLNGSSCSQPTQTITVTFS